MVNTILIMVLIYFMYQGYRRGAVFYIKNIVSYLIALQLFKTHYMNGFINPAFLMPYNKGTRLYYATSVLTKSMLKAPSHAEAKQTVAQIITFLVIYIIFDSLFYLILSRVAGMTQITMKANRIIGVFIGLTSGMIVLWMLMMTISFLSTYIPQIADINNYCLQNRLYIYIYQHNLAIGQIV